MDYRRRDMLEKHIYKLMLIKHIDSLLRFTRKLKTGQSGVSAFDCGVSTREDYFGGLSQ